MRPELEVFDTGHLVFVHELIRDGLIDDPALDPALHGHPLRRAGRPDDAARDGQPPAGRHACSRRSRSGGCSCPSSRWPRSPGGNVRVGLEDNLYLVARAARDERRARRARGRDPRGDERARARPATRCARSSRCVRAWLTGHAHRRPARRRCDRRRLGGAVRAQRRRRPPLRPEPRRPSAASARCSRTRGARSRG